MSNAQTSVADVVAALAAEPAPTPSAAVPPTAPKRGRGRPKGSPTKRRPPAAAAAAAATAATSGPAPKGPGRPTNSAARADRHRDGLTNFYVGLGASMMVFGKLTRQARMADVGKALKVQAADAADSLAKWGETNPGVAKALDMLVNAGGASLVISAHAPIVLAAMGMGAPDDPDGEPDIFDLFASAAASAAQLDLGQMFGEQGDGSLDGLN